MLKNFMHPGNEKNDSKRASPSTPDSAMRAAPPKAIEPARVESRPEAAPNEDGNKLIVGPNIKLKGSEITDCEILVVEGRVEASMNSRDIRIAEGGVFSGKAEIDVAEVRGTFEGELTARKRLVIYATGRVSGVIRYGALTLRATFDPQRLQAELGAVLNDDGRIDARIATGWEAYSPLSGEIAANTDEITWLELFSPDIVEPQGRLDGRIRLSGTRAQPLLGGQARLSQFTTELPALAITLTRFGGHCGFVDRLRGPSWIDREVLAELSRA